MILNLIAAMWQKGITMMLTMLSLLRFMGVPYFSDQVVVDKTQKPIRLVLAAGQVGPAISDGVGKDNVVRRTKQTTRREVTMSEPLTPTPELLSSILPSGNN